MGLSLEHLIPLWGEPHASGNDWRAQAARTVCTDSRGDLAGSLFVPLVGERFDGHHFLEGALRAGAVAGVGQRDRLEGAEADALVARTGAAIWLVDDTLAAYQEIGRLWRSRLRAPVVAVTGSAGKTTTRELIRAALAPLGPVVASQGNENNDVGVPLTLLRADTETAALVVEMGMRGLGEIERLSRCAAPDVAVITNIGTAHIGRLGSREAIATAKCEIVAALRPSGLVVIPAGDPLLEATLRRVWSGRVARVGLAGDARGKDPENGSELPAADWIGQLDPDGRRMTLLRSLEGRQHRSESAGSVMVPLAGEHNARNLLIALAVAAELGVPLQQLTDLTVDVPGGRSRRLEVGGVAVLDETYNASPEAVLAALNLLAREPGRRFAVLGTMLELGEQSVALHRAVAERAAQLGLDGLVIVDEGAEGEAMLAAASGLPRLARVRSPQEAVEPLRQWLEPGDRLLLKASRGIALERLIPLLATRVPA